MTHKGKDVWRNGVWSFDGLATQISKRVKSRIINILVHMFAYLADYIWFGRVDYWGCIIL